ncbi:hypothetical protein [Thioclava indica]|uniref:Uncharacterized protein n=1 Tax=Thioclava indica TaxID=1353528 RepID=A0A074JB98_9RHOB|nr:hypothetical protein DT23_06550 [Thioclava indica]
MNRKLLADAAGGKLAAPAPEEPVLLGSAILGAVAAGLNPDTGTTIAKTSSFAAREAPQH